MAANQMEDVIALIKCQLCSELQSDYRFLPCGHSFCIECLSGWLPNNKTCPKDRMAANTDDAKSLPKNYDRISQAELFRKQNLKDSVSNMIASKLEAATATTQTPSICEGCIEFPAEKFCVDCKLRFCAKCAELSHQIPRMKSHKLTGVESTQLSAPKCKSHDEDMKDYCCSCNKLVCKSKSGQL